MSKLPRAYTLMKTVRPAWKSRYLNTALLKFMTYDFKYEQI